MIREIVIVSGKGGTGKTSLTAAFAALAKNSILCDADVDAADLHLLMQPEVKEQTDFMGGSKAVIDPDLCTGCGTCRTLCRFDAISDRYEVDPIRCEGCGVCVDFCPEQAIGFPVQRCGEWFVSDTRFGPMVHARLGIAEENSGRLVSLVRTKTRQLAEARGLELILTDGPPGIGCALRPGVHPLHGPGPDPVRVWRGEPDPAGGARHLGENCQFTVHEPPGDRGFQSNHSMTTEKVSWCE